MHVRFISPDTFRRVDCAENAQNAVTPATSSPSIPMAPQGLSGKQGEGGLRASVLAGGENFLVKVDIDKICFRGIFCEGPPN